MHTICKALGDPGRQVCSGQHFAHLQCGGNAQLAHGGSGIQQGARVSHRIQSEPQEHANFANGDRAVGLDRVLYPEWPPCALPLPVGL